KLRHEGREVPAYETVLVAHDGHRRQVIVKGTPIRYHDSPASLILLVDITERKRAEDALRESEEKLSLFMRYCPNPVYIKDEDTRAVMLSHHFEKMLGKPLSQLLGKTDEELWSPEFAVGMRADDEKVMKEGCIIEREEIFEERNLFSIKFPIPIPDRPTILGGYTIDITDRKRAEEAMQIQHNLAIALTTRHTMKEALELILDAAFHDKSLDSGGIYVADPVTGALELVVHRAIHPEFVEHMSHFDADASQVLRAKNGTPFYGRYTDIRQPGKDEIRDREGVTALASIPVLHKGNLIAIMNMASHIHDDIPLPTRKLLETLAAQISGALVYIRSEEALRESEERYRTLVASVDEAIILQEKTGEILAWNRAAEQLFGVTISEVLGHTATNRKWKTIREDGTEFLDSEHPSTHTLATGEACKNVVMGITSAVGRFSWVNINTNPLFREGDANPYAVVISLLDITERKRAEEALLASEEKFRHISELIPDFAYSCKKAPGGGFTIDWITGAPEQITGYTSDEIRKMSCWKCLVIDEDIPVFEKNVTGLLPGEFARCELRIRRKDGGIIWLSSYTQCVTDLKEPGNHGLYGACRNITERKRAEEALHKANKQLNLLSDITRHDITNQLLVLRGYLELSHDVIDKPEALKEYIKKEQQAAITIEEQITFTRDYQNLGVAASAWQNVNANIKEAVDRLQMRAVHVEADPANPEVYADPLFEKVFYNLIDNALRY
ncbi:MAG: PAS domain S-box protein, partial [Methanoregula sp.]|nr:PAS domain S-box protein [Methanoregula sp.]